MGRQSSGSGQGSGPKVKASTIAPPARVEAAALEEIGLREYWYAPPGKRVDPRDGDVDSVYLLPEGLVIVTTPTGETQERFLKLISRADGTSKWWQPVAGPVKEAPIAYHYEGNVKTAEFLYRVYDTIQCLDLQYGASLWYKSLDPPITSRLSANDSHVFFGAANGRMYGYKKNSNYADWQYRTGAPISSAPVMAAGRVVVGSQDGNIFGMTPERGYIPFQSWKASASDRIQADLTAYSRWVFAASADYKLYCLEATDGTVFWSFSAGAPILRKPVVYRVGPNKEFAYCITTEGRRGKGGTKLYAIPLPKGSVAPAGVAKWSKKGVLEVVSVGDKTLYVVLAASGGKRMIAGLDVDTGEEKFTLDVDGFDFVLANSADSGRDKKERGKIYLVSRSGGIQVIGEDR